MASVCGELSSRRQAMQYLLWIVVVLCAPLSVHAGPEFRVSAPSKLKAGESLSVEVTLSKNVGKLSAELTDANSRRSLAKKNWSRVKAGRAYPIKYRLKTGRHQLTLSCPLGWGTTKVGSPFHWRWLLCRHCLFESQKLA